MNSSSFIDPSVFVQNSTMTIVELWFIPLDIFQVVCCILILILTILLYTSTASFYYSFLIQALYRYLISIYPTRLLFQSFRFQILIICSSWLFCFVYPFTFVFDGQTIYSSNNQICQLPLSFSFSTIYMTSCLFLCPISNFVCICRFGRISD